MMHEHLLKATATHHAQALGGSVLNSPQNLPKPSHTSCQVAMATGRETGRKDAGQSLWKIVLYIGELLGRKLRLTSYLTLNV